MSDVALAEPAISQHAQVGVPAAPAIPEPTVGEVLGQFEQHLDRHQQKKIAVETLSSIKFLIAPDGTSAISAKELKSPEHRDIIEASLQTILGVRPDGGAYLPPAEGLGEKLGLSSSSHFVKIEGAATIKMLAEAGVKDFAAALDTKQHSHAAMAR